VQSINVTQITYLLVIAGHAGTSVYMAPEVASQDMYNERADVYSFAVVMCVSSCHSMFACQLAWHVVPTNSST
jgi:serine/threonine protein kinase